jgi:arginase family enzyme
MNPRTVAHGCIAATLASALLWCGTASADWTIPEHLEAAANALSAEQRAFLESGEILMFLTERQLEQELTRRDSQSLGEQIDDLRSIAAEMSYDSTRDMGAVPLNLKSKSFNGRQTTPEPLRDIEREPGPFSVHRYLYPASGVPTFGGAKVAIWPEDLVAGDVDVAIVGVPSNASSGRRDSANGPNAMRALDTISIPDVKALINPLDVLSVVDYGDFQRNWMSTELSIEHVASLVAETSATGAVPMLVGGDTSMLYPGVLGVARARNGEAFGLLHFSAHPDAEREGDHTITDRQAVFALLDAGIVAGHDTIQVGLRGRDVTVDTLQWLKDQEVRYHTMAEIEHRGLDEVMKRVLREVTRGPGAFFVSIDVSAIDPAEMVAAGRATANGMPLEVIRQAIRHVCADKDIVGFEITDLAPMMDLSPLSVIHANAVLNACLNGIAVRKAGLDADYVHPLALDHGQ